MGWLEDPEQEQEQNPQTDLNLYFTLNSNAQFISTIDPTQEIDCSGEFKTETESWFEESEQDPYFHKESAQYVCQWIDCKGKFESQTSLVGHIERVHVNGRREDFSCFWLGCPRRNRAFNARYKLLIHMRIHSGFKPNKCTFHECSKAFSRLENLKIHLRSHTGERPYVCPYCPKAFSNSSDRAKHQRTHFDTKPYACTFPACGKRYTDPSSLRKHAKLHFSNPTHFSRSKSLAAADYLGDNDNGGFSSPASSSSSVTSTPSPNSLANKTFEFPEINLHRFDIDAEEEDEDESCGFGGLNIKLENPCSDFQNLLGNLDWMSGVDLGDIENILDF